MWQLFLNTCYDICKLSALLFSSQKYFPYEPSVSHLACPQGSLKLTIYIQNPSPGVADPLELEQKSLHITVAPGGSYAQASIGKNAAANLPVLLIGGKYTHANRALKL